MPMFVVSYADDKETPVEEWQIKDTIPDAVLYRLKEASNAPDRGAPPQPDGARSSIARGRTPMTQLPAALAARPRTDQHDAAELSAEKLIVRFQGLAAISDVSLTVRRHEVFGLIGPNGAGKTTLVNCLTGFQRRPGARRWSAAKTRPAGQPTRFREHGVARTFQAGRLFKDMTVIENVEVTAVGLGLSLRKAHAHSRAMLAWVGLADKTALHAGALRLYRPAAARHRAGAGALAGFHSARRAGGRHVGRRMRGIDGTGRIDPRTFTCGVLLIEHNMRVVMGISQRIHVLDGGARSPKAPPPKSRGMRPCLPPISAWRRDDCAARRRRNHVRYGDLVALRGVSLTVRKARWSASSAPTAPASRPHLPPSPAACPRSPATSGSTAGASSGSGPSRSPGSVVAGAGGPAYLRHADGRGKSRRSAATSRATVPRPRRDMERLLSCSRGCAERLRYPAGRLSGGEQQMLAVARAVMTRPRLLLVDEPSLGLAPKIIDQIYEILLDLRQREKLTLLINEQSSSRILKHRRPHLRAARRAHPARRPGSGTPGWRSDPPRLFRFRRSRNAAGGGLPHDPVSAEPDRRPQPRQHLRAGGPGDRPAVRHSAADQFRPWRFITIGAYALIVPSADVTARLLIGSWTLAAVDYRRSADRRRRRAC